MAIYGRQRKKALQSVENGKRKIIRDDFSGKIEQLINRHTHWLSGSGYYPGDCAHGGSAEGEGLNVDADRAAAMVAGAMQADCLLLFTAVKGLYRRFPG